MILDTIGPLRKIHRLRYRNNFVGIEQISILRASEKMTLGRTIPFNLISVSSQRAKTWIDFGTDSTIRVVFHFSRAPRREKTCRIGADFKKSRVSFQSRNEIKFCQQSPSKLGNTLSELEDKSSVIDNWKPFDTRRNVLHPEISFFINLFSFDQKVIQSLQ